MKSILKQAFGLDLRGLAFLRIAVGIIVIADMAFRLVNLEAHYSDDGLLPRAAAIGWNDLCFSIHYISGKWEIQLTLFALSISCAFNLMVGHKTRLMTVLLWILTISLHNRNAFILQGGDEFVRMILFWAIFLPWGRVWSIDSIWKEKPANYRHVSVGSFGMLLQFLAIYFVSALCKTGSMWREDGTALYYALHLDQLTRPLGIWLSDFHGFMEFVTVYVWWLELLGPFLLIAPFLNKWLRTIAALQIAVFHVGTGFTMMLGVFPWIGTFAMLSLMPPELWRKVETQFVNWGWFGQFGQTMAKMLAIRPGSDSVVLKADDNHGKSTLSNYYRYFLFGSAFLFIVFYNYERLSGKVNVIPGKLRGLGVVLRLDQNWQMFAPNVSDEDGWYMMKGIVASGDSMEVFQPDMTLQTTKPARMLDYYRGDRWRKYLENFYAKRQRLGKPFARFLVRQWNLDNDENLRLVELEIVWFRERTPAYGEKHETERYTLLKYWPAADSVSIY